MTAHSLIAGRGPAALSVSGTALVAVALAAAAAGREAFFHGWLAGLLFAIAIPVGMSVLLATHHLTGGEWGWRLRPDLGAGAACCWLAAPAFLPVLFGLATLYPWLASGEEPSHLVERKLAYLNRPFFLARLTTVLLAWALGGWWLARNSPASSPPDYDLPSARRGRAAGFLAAIYFVTISIAAVDWVATLEPEWYSSVIGLYLLVHMATTGLAAAILIRCLGVRRDESSENLGDLGNLLLAAVALHAYIAFSQYFIIWNGNVSAHASFYALRATPQWIGVIILLGLLHTAIPVSMLTFRALKRRPLPLAIIATLVLVGRLLDAAWLVAPSAEHDAQWAALGIAAVSGAGLGLLVASLIAMRAAAIRRLAATLEATR